MDKCGYHDDMKSDIQNISEFARSQVSWQASYEAKLDNLVGQVAAMVAMQADIKSCMNELAVNLAKNYVTKKEFGDYCASSEMRTVRLHERLDEIQREQKASLWRVIGYVFPAGALVFGVIQWLFSFSSVGGLP